MMPRLMYIEQKTKAGRTLNDQGPSCESEVNCCRTGKTVYVKDLGLRRSNGIYGNYYDEKTHDEYWVSGIKKNGENRRSGNRKKIEKKENVRLKNNG